MRFAQELQQRALTALRSNNLEEAERCYRDLLAIYPHPGVLHNLGLVLVRLRRDAEAVPLFEQSLAARPADTNARLALSNALLHCDRPVEALERCEEVLAADPARRDARHNRAIALRALNRHAEAADVLQALLADDPSDADAEFNLALAELMLERYESAWIHYEARWRGSAAQPPLPPSSTPVWRAGESLAARAVLVQAEQGLGDTIQFLRLLAPLDALSARVDLQLQPDLVAFVRRQWPSRRIDALGALPATDVETRLGLLSLPLALGLKDPGAAGAYLQADPARVEYWRQGLQLDSARRFGVAWRGNPAKRHDRQRSLPLEALRPWLDATAAKGCSVVALQRDASALEREWLARFPHVEVPGAELRDFDDTAAVMALTDQVVSVDTSVIHLAGALGRPAIVLLRFCSDWRWGIDRPDGATYRSVRALRQPAPGDWAPLVRALVDLLP
ncbi:MAG TPA: tetratricopeptide repeat protein [Casimicrobiaceae bacterium]